MPSPPAPPILMPSPPAPPIVMPSPPAPPILMPVIRRSTRSSAITSATLPIMPSLPTTPEAPVQERSHSMTPDSMFSPELPDHPDLQTDDTKIAEIREHMQAFPWLHDVFFNIGTGTEFYLFLDTHSFLPQEGRVSLLSDEPVSNPVSTVRKMLGTIDRFRDNWRGSTTELIKDVNHLISRRITELKSEQNEIKLKYKTGWIPPKQDSPVVQHEEEMLVDKVEHTPQSSSPVVQRVEETPTDTIEHMPQSSQPSNAVILREPSLRIRPPVKHSPPRLKQIFQESFQTKIERATSKEHAKTTSIEIRNERKPRQQLPTHESENESDQGLSPVMEIVDGDLDQKRLFGDDRTEQENEQTSLSLNQMRRNVDGGGPHEHDEKQTKKVQVSVGPLKLPQKSPMKSLVSPVDMQTRQRRNLEASDFQRQWNRSIRENRKKNLTKLSERTPQKSPQQQRQREPFALPDPQVSPETPRRVERVEVQPYAVAFGDEEEEVEEPEMNEGMCLTIQPDLDFPPSFPIQSMEAMIRSPCRLPTIPPCPQPVRSDPEPFFPYFYSLPKVPSMLIVDSYPTSSICKNYSSHAHLIWHYLSLEAFYRKGLVYGIEPGKFTGSTMGVFVVPAPKQKNTFDCGVYVMKGIREYAMQVVRKDKVKALGESDDEEEWRDTRLKREGKQIDVGQTIQTFIDDKVCIVDGIDYTLRFIIDSPESFPVRGSANPKNDSKDKARNTAASSVRQTPQPSMESTPAKHPSVSSVQSSPLQHPVPPSSLDFNLPQLAPFRMSRAGTREDPSTAKSPPTDDGWFSLRSMCLFRFALEDVVFLLNSLLLEVNGGDRDFRVWHQEHNDDEGVPLVLDLFQQQYAMFGKICGFTDNGRELCGYVIRDDVLNTWN
ncbi:hypothetical protein BLNAU_16621 [Blattamonas nauphoetae]|uniref:Ubiquitin-like protease family profile domain-containing protein n=1 Tax=Blattamonas nauphoetae TaxID=2049346 RepID=A0ABQ9X858_9EUKA|nr:hypothetical protein BLNAU_16621 [Blattamonas nauphoetae]